MTVTSISYIGIPVSQSLGEGRLQLFRRLGNSVGYLSHEVDCLDVIKEGARIDRLGLIPEYSCAASDRKVLRTWNR